MASGVVLEFAARVDFGEPGRATGPWAGAGRAASSRTEAPASGCPLAAACFGSPTGTPACCAAVLGAGNSTKRKSGASTRRSRQGKPMPGSPSPSPPKARLNNSVCSARENRPASINRLRSAFVRCPDGGDRPRGSAISGWSDGVGAALASVGFTRSPPPLPEHCVGRRTGPPGVRRARRSDCRSGRGRGIAPLGYRSNPFRSLPFPHPAVRMRILGVPADASPCAAMWRATSGNRRVLPVPNDLLPAPTTARKLPRMPRSGPRLQTIVPWSQAQPR